jgi:hypothetical protein
MHIYSEYHDTFFNVDGRVRNIIGSKVIIRSIIEKYIHESDIINLDIIAVFDDEGIYAAEVIIQLKTGITYFIFLDSILPLTLRQWEYVLGKLGEKHMNC